MCGRYVTPSEAAIERLWNLTKGIPAFPRSWNVAPGATVPLLRLDRETGDLEVVTARWGLIPHWWKDEKPPGRAFNARAEDAAAKPLWRDAMRRGRCIVPAEGWYEWSLKSRPPGAVNRGPLKQPYFIRRADGAPVGFAGLTAAWRHPQTQEWVTSCAILTLPAAGRLAEVHERMPAALPREVHETWLEPGLKDGTAAADLVRSTAGVEGLEAYPVSLKVNSALVDGEELIQPLADPKAEGESRKSEG
jgi:putative SOS response-associated peptidase YedK